MQRYTTRLMTILALAMLFGGLTTAAAQGKTGCSNAT